MGSSLILDNNFDNLNLSSLRIGIIQSEWNSQITDLLMMSCRNYFLEVGIDDENIGFGQGTQIGKSSSRALEATRLEINTFIKRLDKEKIGFG